jgi:hypothetical protein
MSDLCYSEARDCWSKQYSDNLANECNSIQSICSKIWA